jgi:ubiquinone biosynthesis protein
VHEGILKDGRRVIIKVQRPGIADLISQDLRLMKHLISVFEINRPDWKAYNMHELVDEFEIVIHKETDYRIEGRYADRFRKNFEKDPNIKVPLIYWDYSTGNVLVMEYIDGINIKQLLAEGDKKRNKKIAERLLGAYFRQIFEHQFFHADPHPSNIFILPDDRIAYLDFGMMKHLTREFSRTLSDMMLSMILRDIGGIIKNLKASNILPKDASEDELRLKLEDIYTRYLESPDEAEFGRGMEKLLETFKKSKMKVPRDYVFLMRSFIIVEGTVKQLAPDLNMESYLEAYLTTSKSLNFFGKNKIEQIRNTALNAIDSLQALPDAIGNFSKRLADGTIKIEFGQVEDLISELDRVSNRIAASILLAAIMIGSSLIIHAGVGGHYLDLPTIGGFGFIISLVLGLAMVIRIIKKSGI